MKIVNRKDFLALQSGALFAKYRPIILDGPYIKGETSGNDFWFQDFCEIDCDSSGEREEILENSAETGTSFHLDLNSQERDASFDDGQLFVVWDQEDVGSLIERLKQAMLGIER